LLFLLAKNGDSKAAKLPPEKLAQLLMTLLITKCISSQQNFSRREAQSNFPQLAISYHKYRGEHFNPRRVAGAFHWKVTKRCVSFQIYRFSTFHQLIAHYLGAFIRTKI